jgi:hypothetical protein
MVVSPGTAVAVIVPVLPLLGVAAARAASVERTRARNCMGCA